MAKLLGHKTKQLPNGGRVDWDDRLFYKVVNKRMGTKLKKLANIVADDARGNVPIGDIERAATTFKSWAGRKPGNLLRSIQVRKSRFIDGGYIVRVGGRDTYYWFFVEYGTSKMRPYAFMRNAVKRSKHRARWIF